MSKRDTDSNGTLVVTYREDEGEVDKRRLAGILGAATTVMMLLLVITLSLGMVGAAMGVGIGGFVANFGTVDADGGVIYPVVGEQAACDNAPQLEASLSGTATVDRYVEFYKDLPIPSDLSLNNQDHVRISILSNLSSSNVTAQNLDLRLTALEAEDLVLGDNDTTTPKATIQEFGPNQYNYTTSGTNEANASYAPTGAGQNALNGSPATQTPEFGINASTGFSLKNGTAAAHQVAFQQISLPQVDVAVNFINSSFNGDSNSGPASRVINPGERTCSALANASQWDSFNSPGVANTTSGNVGYPSDG
jgi:hypothetical protein